MGPTMFHVKPRQLMGLGNRSGFHCHVAVQRAAAKAQQASSASVAGKVFGSCH